MGSHDRIQTDPARSGKGTFHMTARVFLLKAPSSGAATAIETALASGTVQGITTQLIRRQGLYVAGRAGATYADWAHIESYLLSQNVDIVLAGDGTATPFLDLEEGEQLVVLLTLAGEYP